MRSSNVKKVGLGTVNFLAGLLASFALANCGDGGDGNCVPGAFGCPCSFGSCNPGLVCSNGVCTSVGGDGDIGDGDGDGDGDGEGGDPGGPEVQQLTADAESLTEDEVVTFTAIVDDPDGVEDVFSGRLLAGDTAVSYGFFMNIGGATWQVSMSWQQIDEVTPFTNGEMSFRAEFVDSTELVGFDTISLPGCAAAHDYCGVSCLDVTEDDDNCGACGNACSNSEFCWMSECTAG